MRMGRRIVPEMFPKDLRLLPEHCTALYNAMTPHMPKEAVRALDPEVFFRRLCQDSEVLWGLSMRHAAAWEAALKLALCDLDPEAQDTVLDRLSAATTSTFEVIDGELARVGEGQYVETQITAIIQHLKQENMLPCICFLLDRQGCERLASLVTRELQDQEAQRRESSGWVARRDSLEAELNAAKQRLRKCEEADLTKGDIYDRCCELKKLLRRHLQPKAEFSVSKVTDEEIAEAFGKLRDGKHWSSLVSPGLRAALRRGIGVHHAGMPLKYRQAVERLFRAKRLGTVFATATLALGINMPAKTSVFVRDAVYLNAMNFRQMAGRAGRRGFDLRGHVVFVGMPSTKCFRLMRSDLPKLQGNLVLSNSMALRLIIRQSTLAHFRTRDDGPYHRGVRSCWRLVNLPLFDPLAASAAGLMGKQMAHVFRFSVEYLQRAGLVSIKSDGETEPNDLAAFVAHLFFMEPSNFAFVSLLTADDGALFRRLCQPHPQRDEKVLSILCHLFGRKLLPKSLAEWASCRDSTSGPSVVLLPTLSNIGDPAQVAGESVLEGELVRRLLQRHNDEALRLLEAYCECFAAAHADQLGDDNVLPATGCRLGPTISGTASGLGPELARLTMQPQVRSAFVALSGHGDRFGSVSELCTTLRAGLYLDPQIVPVFELRDSAAPLNAFLLDFFKHGQLEALVRYNRVRKDVIWDELQSFALVLKALHAAMARRSAQARCSGRATPFADADVLATLESISRRFNQVLYQARA
jgi:ATP-dependent RNA helicase DDX60